MGDLKKISPKTIYTINVWHGDEVESYESLQQPTINDKWLTIQSLKKEIHFNIDIINKFEVYE